MNSPTIIKDFPGKSVEEYRVRHHGYLPAEELVWIDSLITAIRSNLHQKISNVELDELKALAIAGSYAIGQNKELP
jgi:hypothetical protein